MKLRNKVAVVTGGSRGIGKVVAEFLCREGARVALVARDRQEISNAARDIARVVDGAKVAGFAVDVADAAALTRRIRAIGKKFHDIDILVNCAGTQQPIGPFAGNALVDWEHGLHVNLLGTVAATHAVLPFMMKRRAGAIVNFSGGGATSSRPHFSSYASAKAAVVRFTEVLADELKPHHIRVNAVAPGAVNTAMLDEVLRMGKRAGDAELAAAKKRAAQGGTPPELAAALVVFLVSRDSHGLTGRLVSAPWDDWRTWNKKRIAKIMAGDALTLQRTKLT